MGFCMVKYLSFHDSSFFGVNITFNVNGKATVCHTPCLFWYVQKKKNHLDWPISTTIIETLAKIES